MPDNSSPLLAVRNLKTYFFLDEGTVRAVDGVDFDVHPGQILGIVGESGCGKSVTIKSILRIVEKPGRLVDGRILFRSGGREEPVDLAQLDPKGKAIRAIRGAEIALIPQEPMAAFSPVHTIGDQILEAILLHQDVSREEAWRMAVQRLDEVGVPDPERRMKAYSWELSGGLRQRAIIAMALACNPRLLIADEPTTAIDVTTQAQILNLLRRLREQHDMAIIFITHDLGVIAQLADYVVVMYLGQVMEAGPVEQIFLDPHHPYTRALLRSIPSIHSPSHTLLPTTERSIPHPFNRPPGCPFHPRCRDAMPGLCDRGFPQRHAIDAQHSVHCFLYDAGAQEAPPAPPATVPESPGQP